MFTAKAFTVATLILAGAKAFEVSTPSNVVQCGDTEITVSGVTGQYHVSIVPSVNPCESDALFESDALTGDSYTWKANLPAGTEAVIVVDDESGNEAWSTSFTVGEGDASCLPSSSADPSPLTPSTTSSHVDNAYTVAPSTQTNIGVNNVSKSASSTPSLDAPINAQDNTPSTGAALSNAQASIFTMLAAMGVVAIAL